MVGTSCHHLHASALGKTDCHGPSSRLHASGHSATTGHAELLQPPWICCRCVLLCPWTQPIWRWSSWCLLTRWNGRCAHSSTSATYLWWSAIFAETNPSPHRWQEQAGGPIAKRSPWATFWEADHSAGAAPWWKCQNSHRHWLGSCFADLDAECLAANSNKLAYTWVEGQLPVSHRVDTQMEWEPRITLCLLHRWFSTSWRWSFSQCDMPGWWTARQRTCWLHALPMWRDRCLPRWILSYCDGFALGQSIVITDCWCDRRLRHHIFVPLWLSCCMIHCCRMVEQLPRWMGPNSSKPCTSSPEQTWLWCH